MYERGGRGRKEKGGVGKRGEGEEREGRCRKEGGGGGKRREV